MSSESAIQVSAALAEFAAALRYEDLPADVALQAKQALLDVLGIALAGARVGEGWREVAGYARAAGAGGAQASVWSSGERLPAGLAALVNAAQARALDYDDIIDFPQVHVTVCLAPAAIAVAQSCTPPRPGRRLLAALAAGAEIQSRLAAAIAPRFGAGLPVMLASQLFGYVSAAAACGSVLGLDARRMLSALGLAQMQAAGTEEMVVHATASAGKVLYAGLCNQGGAQAALMARAGVLAEGDPVAGKAGLLQSCFPGAHELAPLTEGLGSRYAALRRCFKPLPGTLVAHAFVEAARSLAQRHGLRAEDIARVRLRVGPWGQAMSEPFAERRRPPTSAAAMNSVPFAVARVLAHGGLDVADFGAEGRADPATVALAERIEHVPDPSLARPGGMEPGIVAIECADGRQLEERVDTAAGQPARPLSFDDVEAKFRRNAQCAAPRLPEAAVDGIVAAVRDFENLEDLDGFLRGLAAPRR